MQEKTADKKRDDSDENVVENVDKDAFDDKKEEEIKEEPTYDELLEELNLLKDRLMRALADSENTRKRGERDRKDAELYGGTKLARDLLSVYDNLSRVPFKFVCFKFHFFPVDPNPPEPLKVSGKSFVSSNSNFKTGIKTI